MDLDIDEAAVAEDARKNYSLRDRLAKVSRRTKTVTVYTDAEAGALLGSAEDEKIGQIPTGRKVRTGLIGELDEIQERAQKRIRLLDEEADDYDDRVKEISESIAEESAAVAEKVAEVRKRLDATSYTFTLQALPDIIVRDMHRKTKRTLGVKGKKIPEDLEDDYWREYTAQMLAASVSSWTDKGTGETFTELSVDDAHALRDLLPPGQFPRLDRAMVELSVEVTISNQATDSADFS